MGSKHHPEQHVTPSEMPNESNAPAADVAVGEPVSEAPSTAVEPTAEQQIESLQKELIATREQADQNWQKLLLAKADMENLRRRTEKELENAHRFALEKFSKELLQVLDSLEMGLKTSESASDNLESMRQGMALTLKQFLTTLEKFNVVQIDPQGQPFDPAKQQAMSMQPSADVPPNTVLHVFQKGYELNGRLIRPAMVVVSQAVAPQPEKKIDEQA